MKPTIRRHHTGRWTVHEPDGTATQFRSFAQAVAHADEIARTVTITLPPYQPRRGVEEFNITDTTDEVNVFHPWRLEGIDIRPSTMKPLALALLATAHYHERRNQ